MTYNEGLASLARRAKWACGLLWLFIGLSAFGIIVLLSPRLSAPSEVLIIVVNIAGLIYVVLSLVAVTASAIAIPAWTHRAWANLHLLGLRGLRRRPWWAAMSYFVPVAGLFVPFLAMRELYNRSTGEDEDHDKTSVADVTSWWTCYIAGTFVTGFIVLIAFFNLNGRVFVVTSPIMNEAIAIFGNLLMIGAAWFLIRTVRTITAAQASSAGVSETFA